MSISTRRPKHGPPFFHRTVTPIRQGLEAETCLHDYGHIVTVLPPLDRLNQSDVRRYLEARKEEVSRLEARSTLAGIRKLTSRLRYVTGLLLRKGKAPRIRSLHEGGTWMKVITQTPSEVVAVTLIELDGDIIFRIPDGGVHERMFDLYRVHEANVRHAVLLWREDIRALIDVVKFAKTAWRVAAVASVLSTLGSIGFSSVTETVNLLVVSVPILTSVLTFILHSLGE